MTMHSRIAFGVMLLAALTPQFSHAGSSAELMTFEGVEGQRYFALSLQASDLPAPQKSAVVLLVDTSASQTGAYRSDSLEAARQIVGSLPANARVQVAAIDLNVVPMGPLQSAKVASSTLAKLQRRVPLGSTDLHAGLRAAIELFESADSTAARQLIYIGDGFSRADLMTKKQFAELSSDLAKNRVTVSSYAIGPHRDLSTLVALANQTGGQVFVDSATTSGQQAGQVLARAAASPVVWLDGSLTALGEHYPSVLPPLRTDRETIVIGALSADDLPSQVKLTGKCQGRDVNLNCSLTVRKSSEDFEFLPRLVAMAREDKGATLNTLGKQGLMAVGRQMVAPKADAKKVSVLDSYETWMVQDEEPLDLFSDEALPADDAGLDAELDLGPAEEVAPTEAFVDEPTVAAPAPTVVEGGTIEGEIFGSGTGVTGVFVPSNTAEPASGLLDEAMEARRVNQEYIKSEVSRGLDQARQQLRANPGLSIVELKSLREAVRQAPDLEADTQSQLIDRIDSALRQANNRKVEKDHADALLRQRQAQDLERQRFRNQMRRDDDLIRTYIEQFNSRMAERRYDLATETSVRAFEVNPNLVVTNAVLAKGQIATAQHRIQELRARRQQAVLDTLYSVEESLMPFNDNEPLVYPDAQTWENLTNSRKKYAQVDFATMDGAEQRITEELSKPTSIDFFDEPLGDALQFLEQLHGIQIEVNQAKLEADGLDTNALVTKQLSGITLKSALKLMLQDLGLTYVIEDEVLQITTPDDALGKTVTKVYPVADLVLPIQSIGGGMMGGGMMGGGMGGGMMGGGMGGGGMMGGGMGGGMMGGGMGMGGGFFDVTDEVSLDQAKARTATKRRRPQAIELEVATGESVEQAWDNFFQQPTEDISEADLRKTLREKMGRRKIDEVVTILQAALRNGYVKPWMYEALGLALQAAQAPKSEVERAIMSAVDLTDDQGEVMMAAIYLARNGIEARALKLFQEVSEANPLRPEPYQHGMRLASKLNDVDGIKWATTGILGQAWTKEQQHLVQEAKNLAKGKLIELMKAGDSEAESFRLAVTDALIRDCEVILSWTGKADLDAIIEEPGGALCWVQNPRTTSGGVLTADAFAHDRNEGEIISERYVCPKGFTGVYRMLVRRVWGEVTAGKVTIDIYTNRHTKDEKHIRRQIPLSDKDALVIFDVTEGRRVKVLPEEQVASVVNTQIAANRSVLAQQLNQRASESEAMVEFAIARNRLRNGQLPFARNGAVGFRPELTLLPEGANLISATAVISADRRYVRFSGLPFFSTIGEVQTFNFATGNTGTNGGGLGGGLGGGGLGGGGLGGGFGGGF